MQTSSIWKKVLIFFIFISFCPKASSQDINYWRSLSPSKDDQLNEEVAKTRAKARQFLISGKTSKVDSLYRAYRAIIIKQGDKTNISRYLNDMGNYHTEIDSSIYYYQMAIDFISKDETSAFIWGLKITSMINLGITYNQELENPKKAIEILEEALILSDTYHYPGLKLSIIRNLASISNRQNDQNHAIQLVESGLEDFKYTNYFIGENGFDYYSLKRFLGTLYHNSEDNQLREKGFQYILEAKDFFEKINNNLEVSLALADLVKFYPDMLKKGQDMIYIDQALSYYEGDKNEKYRKHIELVKGITLARNGKNKKSQKLLNQLKKKYPKDSTSISASIYSQLYEINKQNKNFKDALYYHEQILKSNDKKAAKYYSKEVLDLQSKYDTERKSRVVELLKAKNKTILKYTLISIVLLLISLFSLLYLWKGRLKIKKQNQELSEMNKAKNDLFMILAHDLKGPLLSFENLSSRVSHLLQKGNYEGLHKLGDYYAKVGNAAKYTVSSLLDWSLSQKDNFLLKSDFIDVHTALEKIQQDLNYIIIDKNIVIKVSNKDVDKVWCDENSFIIIYRNLIHNAIKYSDPGTNINIYTESINEKVIITIENKSTQMPLTVYNSILELSQNKQEFVSMNMRDSGIGLQTVFKLIYHNNAEIKFSKKEDTFSVQTVLPKNSSKN